MNPVFTSILLVCIFYWETEIINVESNYEVIGDSCYYCGGVFFFFSLSPLSVFSSLLVC